MKTDEQLKSEGWVRVSFLGDVLDSNGLPFDFCGDEPDAFCSLCGDEYTSCPCPWPTMKDEYDYEESSSGVLWAKQKENGDEEN